VQGCFQNKTYDFVKFDGKMIKKNTLKNQMPCTDMAAIIKNVRIY
jgi:hypothetical protein